MLTLCGRRGTYGTGCSLCVAGVALTEWAGSGGALGTTHNSFFTHTTLSHTILLHTPLSHTTLSHTTLDITSFTHTTLTHNSFTTLRLCHTHTQPFTHNFVTYNSFTHTQDSFTHTHKLPHTTLRHKFFPSHVHICFVLIGRSLHVGLSGPLIFLLPPLLRNLFSISVSPFLNLFPFLRNLFSPLLKLFSPLLNLLSNFCSRWSLQFVRS